MLMHVHHRLTGTLEPVRRIAHSLRIPALLLLSSLALSGCWLTDSVQNNNQIIIVGTWTGKGGSLNVNNGGNQDASNPRITLLGSTPYVAWIENNVAVVAQVYVKHWDGSAWVADEELLTPGLNVDVTKAATGGLDIASDGTSVYIAWTETGSGAHVKKLNVSAGTWTELGTGASSLSQDASPVLSSSRGLAFVGGVLYAIVIESGVVKIKHFNSIDSRWDRDLPDLNASGGTSPALVTFGSTLYAGWVEGGALMVSRRSGPSWVESDFGLPTSSASDPSMTVSGGFLYIGWTESSQTFVAWWDGSAWNDLFFGPDPAASTRTSSSLRLAPWPLDVATVFVTPSSGGIVRSSLYLALYDTWTELGDGLNVNQLMTASSPAIAGSSSSGPWVAWIEPDASGQQLYVNHWE